VSPCSPSCSLIRSAHISVSRATGLCGACSGARRRRSFAGGLCGAKGEKPVGKDEVVVIINEGAAGMPGRSWVRSAARLSTQANPAWPCDPGPPCLAFLPWASLPGLSTLAPLPGPLYPGPSLPGLSDPWPPCLASLHPGPSCLAFLPLPSMAGAPALSFNQEPQLAAVEGGTIVLHKERLPRKARIGIEFCGGRESHWIHQFRLLLPSPPSFPHAPALPP